MTFNFLSIYKKSRVPSWILGVWILWTGLYTWVATEMGFDLRVALIDSLASNMLLAVAAFLLVNILKYYTPGKGRYINLVALTIAITLLWYVSSRAIFLFVLKTQIGSESFWGKDFADSTGHCFPGTGMCSACICAGGNHGRPGTTDPPEIRCRKTGPGSRTVPSATTVTTTFFIQQFKFHQCIGGQRPNAGPKNDPAVIGIFAGDIKKR